VEDLLAELEEINAQLMPNETQFSLNSLDDVARTAVDAFCFDGAVVLQTKNGSDDEPRLSSSFDETLKSYKLPGNKCLIAWA